MGYKVHEDTNINNDGEEEVEQFNHKIHGMKKWMVVPQDS